MKTKLLTLAVCLAVAGPLAAAEQMNSDAAAPTAPAAAEQAAPAGTVARSAITTAVQDREPIDSIKSLTADNDKVYYFTELKGMEGHKVTHRWEYNGKIMAEIPFEIGGPRWRVFSSKNLDTGWQGEWTVSVLDENGGTLSVNTFNYTKPAEGAADTAAPAASETPEAPAQ